MFVEAGDVKLHVNEIGEGKPVVFLHGLVVGSIATWYFTTASALSKSNRSIMYDLRGHGKSDRPLKGYDIQSMVVDLENLLDELEISEPISLVGHSYGSSIALHYALKHPEKVERLALVDMPVNIRETVAKPLLDVSNQQDIVDGFPDFMKAQWAEGKKSVTRLVKQLEYLFFESSLREEVAGNPAPTKEQLAKIDLPLLCIYGEQSDCLSEGKSLFADYPSCRFETLPCGHFVTMEAAGPMTDIIEEFFNGA